MKKVFTISKIWSDYGGEFENKEFEHFSDQNGFQREFSATRTPQQNMIN